MVDGTDARRRGLNMTAAWIAAAVGVAVAVLVVLASIVLGSARTVPPQARPGEAGPSVEAAPAATPAESTMPHAWPHPSAEALPAELAPLANESLSLDARDALLRRLPGTLTPETAQGILDLLDMPGVHATVRNNAANRLAATGDAALQERLVALLDDMVRDPGHSAEWRDYCVQHLRGAYERTGSAGALAAVSWAATEISGESLTGEERRVRMTALYSLGIIARTLRERGAEANPTGDAHKVNAQLVSEITEALDPANVKAADVGANAVRTACIAGMRDLVPKFRRMLGDEKEPVQVRIALASVLGQFRDAESLPMLKELARSAEGGVKAAAERSARMIRAGTPGF